MLSVVFFGLVYWTAVAPTAINDRSFKIHNGEHITDWDKVEYKFIVMLISDEYATCTGSFVSAKKILTAGHCVCNPKAMTDTAVLEHVNTIPFANWDKRKIVSTKINPAYVTCGQVSGVDVAVGTLEREVDLKSVRITLAKVAFDGDPQYGDEVIIIGYGHDSKHNDQMELRVGKTMVVTCDDKTVPHKPICLRSSLMYNWQHTRPGDSGGPLIWKRMGEAKVYGVLSGGLVRTEDMSDTSFASTTLNQDFIQRNF